MTVLGAIGWPILDRIHLFGSFAVSPHGIGIAIGFLFGAWIFTREGPKRGVTLDDVNAMVFWALIGAIVGARLFYVIAHYSDFNGIGDMLAVYRGGISLLGGIAGAVLINIPLMRRRGYRFFQVMDGAVVGLSFGIAYGRIGDLIIGDHFGKPSSWLLAFQYKGGTPAGYECLSGVCTQFLQGGQQIRLARTGATLLAADGQVLATGVGVHQTALYDMIGASALFLVLYSLSRTHRRLGILTLTFGAWYGALRVVEDFLRVDKRFFGLTGSQWTGLTVSIVCLLTLLAWAVRPGSGEPRESVEPLGASEPDTRA